jgi:hypothetical protein
MFNEYDYLIANLLDNLIHCIDQIEQILFITEQN